MFIMVSIYYGSHGPMRCALYCLFIIKPSGIPEVPPRPIFGRQLFPQLVTPGRLLPRIPFIPLSLYPDPARDHSGLIRPWQGVSALLPFWAEMGPDKPHYYYR